MSEELLKNNITIEENLGIKKIDGHRIYFDYKDEFLLNTLKNYERSEKLATEVIKKNVIKGMTVVNIGANVGYYTLLLARQVGKKGFVYSFEPFLHTVEILKTTIEKNEYSNIEIISKAVTNKTGIEEMLVTPSGMHNIITPLDNPELEKIKIEVTTLDDFFVEKDIKIDFLMMDAEGSEPYILDGMKKIIENNPGIEIITEYNAFSLGIAGYKAENFYEKIKNHGFNVFNIDDSVQKTIPISKEELLDRYADEGMKTMITNLYLTKNSNKDFSN